MGDVPKTGQPRPHSRDLRAMQIMTDAVQILDVVKREWGSSWSDFDQHVRDRITTWLTAYHAEFDGPFRYETTADGKPTTWDQLPTKDPRP